MAILGLYLQPRAAKDVKDQREILCRGVRGPNGQDICVPVIDPNYLQACTAIDCHACQAQSTAA